MKAKFYLPLILTIIFGFNVSKAQNNESMPFKEFIEIADFLDDDDKLILRQDEELMNAEIYLSFEAAKRAIGANVLALAVNVRYSSAADYQNLLQYQQQMKELSYFPNLKFIKCNYLAPLLNYRNNLKYVYLFQTRDSYNENIFESLVNCKIISFELYAKPYFLSELPLLTMNSLVKLSLTVGRIKEDCFGTLVNYPNLKYLDLSNNKIRALPINYQIPNTIKKINLTGNKVGKNIDVIIDYSNLEYLNLSDNDISRIDMLNTPMLRELDLSDNQISKMPGSLQMMNNLETLNLARNEKIEMKELLMLGFLDTLDISLTKINFSMDDLLELRFALPNTALVFSKNMEMDKTISGKIEEGEIDVLSTLKSNWEAGDFMATVRLGKYFADKDENFLSTHIFRKITNPYIFSDFKISFALSKYLDEHDMQTLADNVYTAIINARVSLDFKTSFRFTKAMSTYHSNLAKQAVVNVNSNDSLNYFLKDRNFRIEFAALLYRLGYRMEADQHFNIVYNDLDISNDKDVQEVAKYFEENYCYQFAIQLYQRIEENPEITE